MEQMTLHMLHTSADGVFFYEHAGNDDRTWKTICSVWQRYASQIAPTPK